MSTAVGADAPGGDVEAVPAAGEGEDAADAADAAADCAVPAGGVVLEAHEGRARASSRPVLARTVTHIAYDRGGLSV